MLFKKCVFLLGMSLLALPVLAQDATPRPAHDAARLILATTTSTVDSGLLEAILPAFTEQTGYEVDVVSVGSGQALELGRNGDADVLLVHDRPKEDEFVEQDYAQARADVMFNDFIIVGIEDDPAGIAGMGAAEAFQTIASAEATFVSRGDDSGTHSREKRVWASAELEPSGTWYISAGQGMGAVLNMSDELGAYTLTDRATYVARQAEGLRLVILVEGDTALLNPYGVMAVNPERHPHVNASAAQAFVEWITSVETQQSIGEFTLEGQTLFFPQSEAWLTAQAMPAEATPEATTRP